MTKTSVESYDEQVWEGVRQRADMQHQERLFREQAESQTHENKEVQRASPRQELLEAQEVDAARIRQLRGEIAELEYKMTQRARFWGSELQFAEAWPTIRRQLLAKAQDEAEKERARLQQRIRNGFSL